MHSEHLNKIFHLKSDLGKLYTHVAGLGFASSTVTIFIPIFLLTQGFSLTQVFIFLILDWGMFGLFSPLYGKIIRKIGMREVILLRTPIFALVLLALFFMPEYSIIQSLYWLIAIVKGFAGSLHSLSIQSMFTSNIGEKMNENTSKFIAFPKLAGLLGPAIGGFVIVAYGFSALFISVIALLLIAIIPLWFMKETIDHPDFDFKELLSLKKYGKDFVKMALYGYITFIYFTIIPLAIYLKSADEFGTGLLVTTISFIGALFTIYVGKLCDKKDSKNIIKFGALTHTILFLVLGMITSTELFFWLVLISGFVSVLIMVPYETTMYKKAKNSKPLEYLIFKEFSIYWGRLALMILIIVFSSIDSGLLSGGLTGILWMFF
jgi:MFS family permease